MLIASKTQIENIQTMSSREIAELCKKEHKNVLRVIRELIDAHILVAQIEPLKFEYRGQQFDYYELNKRDSMVVVARLSPEFMAAVVDRWQELEAQASKPVDPMAALSDPNMLRGLLLSYSEKVIALQSEVNELIPKAKALDTIANAMGQKTITNVAKVLGVQPEKFLRPWMIKHHWIHIGRDGQYHAHAARIKDGHLVEKSRAIPRTSGIADIKVTVYVTALGETLLARRFAGEIA